MFKDKNKFMVPGKRAKSKRSYLLLVIITCLLVSLTTITKNSVSATATTTRSSDLLDATSDDPAVNLWLETTNSNSTCLIAVPWRIHCDALCLLTDLTLCILTFICLELTTALIRRALRWRDFCKLRCWSSRTTTSPSPLSSSSASATQNQNGSQQPQKEAHQQQQMQCNRNQQNIRVISAAYREEQKPYESLLTVALVRRLNGRSNHNHNNSISKPHPQAQWQTQMPTTMTLSYQYYLFLLLTQRKQRQDRMPHTPTQTQEQAAAHNTKCFYNCPCYCCLNGCCVVSYSCCYCCCCNHTDRCSCGYCNGCISYSNSNNNHEECELCRPGYVPILKRRRRRRQWSLLKCITRIAKSIILKVNRLPHFLHNAVFRFWQQLQGSQQRLQQQQQHQQQHLINNNERFNTSKVSTRSLVSGTGTVTVTSTTTSTPTSTSSTTTPIPCTDVVSIEQNLQYAAHIVYDIANDQQLKTNNFCKIFCNNRKRQRRRSRRRRRRRRRRINSNESGNIVTTSNNCGINCRQQSLQHQLQQKPQLQHCHASSYRRQSVGWIIRFTFRAVFSFSLKALKSIIPKTAKLKTTTLQLRSSMPHSFNGNSNSISSVSDSHLMCTTPTIQALSSIRFFKPRQRVRTNLIWLLIGLVWFESPKLMNCSAIIVGASTGNPWNGPRAQAQVHLEHIAAVGADDGDANEDIRSIRIPGSIKRGSCSLCQLTETIFYKQLDNKHTDYNNNHNNNNNMQNNYNNNYNNIALSDRVRLESIKRQILSKLGLTQKPNVSHPLPKQFIWDTIYRADGGIGGVGVIDDVSFKHGHGMDFDESGSLRRTNHWRMFTTATAMSTSANANPELYQGGGLSNANSDLSNYESKKLHKAHRKYGVKKVFTLSENNNGYNDDYEEYLNNYTTTTTNTQNQQQQIDNDGKEQQQHQTQYKLFNNNKNNNNNNKQRNSANSNHNKQNNKSKSYSKSTYLIDINRSSDSNNRRRSSSSNKNKDRERDKSRSNRAKHKDYLYFNDFSVLIDDDNNNNNNQRQHSNRRLNQQDLDQFHWTKTTTTPSNSINNNNNNKHKHSEAEIYAGDVSENLYEPELFDREEYFGNTQEIITFAEKGNTYQHRHRLVEFPTQKKQNGPNQKLHIHQAEIHIRFDRWLQYDYSNQRLNKGGGGGSDRKRKNRHQFYTTTPKKKLKLWIFQLITGLNTTTITTDKKLYPEHDEVQGLDEIARFCASFEVDTAHLGWQKFDLTSTVRDWYERSRSNGEGEDDKLRLLIDCTGCGSQYRLNLFDIEEEDSVTPTSSQLKFEGKKSNFKHSKVDSTNLNPNRPFLVLHTETKRLSRVRRRAVDCGGALNGQCCKESFYVSFKALGWDDWIIAPRGYFANYCRGECTGPFRTPDTFQTFHAHFIEEYRKMGLLNGMKPCCAPVKFSSMSLIYYGDDGIIKRDLPKMVVDECGCP